MCDLKSKVRSIQKAKEIIFAATTFNWTAPVDEDEVLKLTQELIDK